MTHKFFDWSRFVLVFCLITNAAPPTAFAVSVPIACSSIDGNLFRHEAFSLPIETGLQPLHVVAASHFRRLVKPLYRKSVLAGVLSAATIFSLDTIYKRLHYFEFDPHYLHFAVTDNGEMGASLDEHYLQDGYSAEIYSANGSTIRLEAFFDGLRKLLNGHLDQSQSSVILRQLLAYASGSIDESDKKILVRKLPLLITFLERTSFPDRDQLGLDATNQILLTELRIQWISLVQRYAYPIDSLTDQRLRALGTKILHPDNTALVANKEWAQYLPFLRLQREIVRKESQALNNLEVLDRRGFEVFADPQHRIDDGNWDKIRLMAILTGLPDDLSGFQNALERSRRETVHVIDLRGLSDQQIASRIEQIDELRRLPARYREDILNTASRYHLPPELLVMQLGVGPSFNRDYDVIRGIHIYANRLSRYNPLREVLFKITEHYERPNDGVDDSPSFRSRVKISIDPKIAKAIGARWGGNTRLGPYAIRPTWVAGWLTFPIVSKIVITEKLLDPESSTDAAGWLLRTMIDDVATYQTRDNSGMRPDEIKVMTQEAGSEWNSLLADPEICRNIPFMPKTLDWALLGYHPRAGWVLGYYFWPRQLGTTLEWIASSGALDGRPLRFLVDHPLNQRAFRKPTDRQVLKALREAGFTAYRTNHAQNLSSPFRSLIFEGLFGLTLLNWLSLLFGAGLIAASFMEGDDDERYVAPKKSGRPPSLTPFVYATTKKLIDDLSRSPEHFGQGCDPQRLIDLAMHFDDLDLPNPALRQLARDHRYPDHWELFWSEDEVTETLEAIAQAADLPITIPQNAAFSFSDIRNMADQLTAAEWALWTPALRRSVELIRSGISDHDELARRLGIKRKGSVIRLMYLGYHLEAILRKRDDGLTLNFASFTPREKDTLRRIAFGHSLDEIEKGGARIYNIRLKSGLGPVKNSRGTYYGDLFVLAHTSDFLGVSERPSEFLLNGIEDAIKGSTHVLHKAVFALFGQGLESIDIARRFNVPSIAFIVGYLDAWLPTVPEIKPFLQNYRLSARVAASLLHIYRPESDSIFLESLGTLNRLAPGQKQYEIYRTPRTRPARSVATHKSASPSKKAASPERLEQVEAEWRKFIGQFPLTEKIGMVQALERGATLSVKTLRSIEDYIAQQRDLQIQRATVAASAELVPTQITRLEAVRAAWNDFRREFPMAPIISAGVALDHGAVLAESALQVIERYILKQRQGAEIQAAQRAQKLLRRAA